MEQHHSGEGSNHTRKYAPVELVYFEEFDRIDFAFSREKQIQRWSHGKKEALVLGFHERLKELAVCNNETNSSRFKPDMK